MSGVELAYGVGDLGAGVFDVLCLIEDTEVEGLRGEEVEIAVQECVGGECDVGIGKLGKPAVSVGALQDGDFQ